MSYGRFCEEKGCKNLATKQIHVVLRSRPEIKPETSNPLGYVCDDHMLQTMDEYIPAELWDKMLLSFALNHKVMPIRTVSYLIIKPYKQFNPI